jgi:transposase
VDRVWAGIDIGKQHHHCVVVDAEGKRLFSRRVVNDETELRTLVADVTVLGKDVTWAVDIVSEALPTWSIRLSGARRGGTTNE